MNKIFIILFLTFYNFFFNNALGFADENKIKIGLLVPLSGENALIGEQIVKATRLALKDINSDKLEIIPKDTKSDPNKTLRSAIELDKLGINLVIGPVFYKNLSYLNEVKNLTFLSFTNKTLDLPKNVISTGINSTSQLNTIKKFVELNEIEKTVFLIPNSNYNLEIKQGIKNSKDTEIAKKNLLSKKWKIKKSVKLISLIEKKKNISSYQLSIEQVNAILELRLQKLTALGINEIEVEIKKLAELITKYKKIISSKKELLKVISEELKNIKEKFAVTRRTKIIDAVLNYDIEETIQKQSVIITVTLQGFIKSGS